MATAKSASEQLPSARRASRGRGLALFAIFLVVALLLRLRMEQMKRMKTVEAVPGVDRVSLIGLNDYQWQSPDRLFALGKSATNAQAFDAFLVNTTNGTRTPLSGMEARVGPQVLRVARSFVLSPNGNQLPRRVMLTLERPAPLEGCPRLQSRQPLQKMACNCWLSTIWSTVRSA